MVCCSPSERLAFCRMVHALEELDADLLIDALVDLGFQMQVRRTEGPF